MSGCHGQLLPHVAGVHPNNGGLMENVCSPIASKCSFQSDVNGTLLSSAEVWAGAMRVKR